MNHSALHRPPIVMAAVALLASAILLTGCSTSASQTTAGVTVAPVSSERAKTYLLDAFVKRAEITETVTIESDLEDLVPNHEFTVQGESPQTLAEGIVFGSVQKAVPGAAYAAAADDTVDVEVPFSSSRAQWRVVVLTIKVDHGLGTFDGRNKVTVGAVIDGVLDPAVAIEGYKALGRVALVLNRPGKFAFDPELYSIRQSGALLGLVSDDGAIDFPALGAESADFVGDLDTVTDVVAENRRDVDVVTVKVAKNDFVRSDEK